MITQYGYEFHILQAVYHNGKFSHNNQRFVIRHLAEPYNTQILKNNPRLANISLQPGECKEVHEGLTVETSDERIHSVEYLGIAEARIVYDYRKDVN